MIPTITPPTAQSPTSSLLQAVSARATAPPLDSGYSTPSYSTSAPKQQPDLDLNLNRPPADEPGIVPQPAGLAPRRCGDVHVWTVQDDRARVCLKLARTKRHHGSRLLRSICLV